MSTLTLQRPAVSVAPRLRGARGSWWLLVNVAALMALAIFLRSWRLDNLPGVNGDEAWSGVQAIRYLSGEGMSWRTPSGNPVNVFFMGPLIALHAIAAPSFVLLRLVSLASGVAALAANYALCRRAFDVPTAVVSTVILAVLPINIAYSRFAWDTSQSLLATVLVLYLPLVAMRATQSSGRWLIAAVLAYLAAVIVHPTNLLTLPFLLAPTFSTSRPYLVDAVRKLQQAGGKRGAAAVFALGALLGYVLWPRLALPAARLSSPAELAHFADQYLKLFSGGTVYEFISGAGASGWSRAFVIAGDWMFGLVALVGLVGLHGRVRHRLSPGDWSLVVGWFMMLCGFIALAGTGAIRPHFERYAICLIAPAVLLLARGLTWWSEASAERWPRRAALLVLPAWFFLASFHGNYFWYVEQTGGTSHRAFRTAAIEPKRAALECVLAARTADEPVNVICHEWWTYWPVAYLARGQRHVNVLSWERGPGEAQFTTECTWFIEFAGSAGEAAALASFASEGISSERATICDYESRPLITVIGPGRKYLRNY